MIISALSILTELFDKHGPGKYSSTTETDLTEKEDVVESMFGKTKDINKVVKKDRILCF